MRCDRARPALLTLSESNDLDLASGEFPPGVDPAAGRHIAQCLRCQAELAQHRRIRRQMAQLRSVTVEPAPTMLDSILAGLAEQAVAGVSGSGQRATHRRRLLAVGAAAAASAGVAGAVVLLARSRRARPDGAAAAAIALAARGTLTGGGERR